MEENRSQFLNTMVAILRKLHDTSVSKGEPLLASVLEIARKEAEDALRHAGDLNELSKRRTARSSTQSWRACDRPPEEDVATAEKAPAAKRKPAAAQAAA